MPQKHLISKLLPVSIDFILPFDLKDPLQLNLELVMGASMSIFDVLVDFVVGVGWWKRDYVALQLEILYVNVAH